MLGNRAPLSVTVHRRSVLSSARVSVSKQVRGILQSIWHVYKRQLVDVLATYT